MFATLGVASLLVSSQAFSPMGKARMSAAKLSMATVVAPAATETQLATVRCLFNIAQCQFSYYMHILSNTIL